MQDKKQAEKKQAVLGQDKSKASSKLIALIVVVLAVAAGGAYVVMSSGGGEIATTSTSTSPTTSPGTGKTDSQQPAASSDVGKVVTFKAATFDDGKARHYSYKASEDIEIRFFVLKSSDGVIRAAFDACDVCWRSGRGYAQDGDEMICRNCGLRFASIRINEVRGGCNPSPLDRRVENGQVIITVADIMTGAKYFNFKQG